MCDAEKSHPLMFALTAVTIKQAVALNYDNNSFIQ
jgi:hypothetical protein